MIHNDRDLSWFVTCIVESSYLKLIEGKNQVRHSTLTQLFVLCFKMCCLEDTKLEGGV